ncbi:hypothetical protein QIA30_04815 [Borreliella turdi]|uniref:hypothetical protein n=1 Tax=Borreliella turdi TaxID=57863 RepID=UPI00264928EB|nr:hypothetical protein [Borreliella turdi]WKC79287.1 hypothetical protein QIA30_04815 [Borreliella turdi]
MIFLSTNLNRISACLSYADTFVTGNISLSCNGFKQAINEFNAADIIVGPISGMTYSGLRTQINVGYNN